MRILLAIMVCLCGSFLAAQDEPESVTIAGKVEQLDGSAASGGKVQLRYKRRATIEVTCDEQGRFTAEVPLAKSYLPSITIRSLNQAGTQVLVRELTRDDEPHVGNLILKLQPAKTAIVQVDDQENRPIKDANVLLDVPGFLLRGATNETGAAKFAIPEDSPVEVAIAWKKEAGLDYEMFRAGVGAGNFKQVSVRPLPVDKTIRLRLTGSRSVDVYVTDHKSRPLEGVELSAWIMRKAPQPQLNLNFYRWELYDITDSHGHVQIGWIPVWQTGNINFFAQKDRNQKQFWFVADANTPCRVQMDPIVSITGQVRHADGTPVDGIPIWARGFDAKGLTQMDSGKSRNGGRYELMIPAGSHVMLGAGNSDWAAGSYESVITKADEPITDKDFVLRKPTRIHGVLNSTFDGKPIPDENVSLQYVGLTGQQALFGSEKSNIHVWLQPVGQTVNAQTDSEGRFEFFVGDGKFKLDRAAEPIDIRGEAELQIDLTRDYKRPMETRGRVFITQSDATSNISLDGIVVKGEIAQEIGRTWTALTDAKGEFTITRSPKSAYVQAITADGKYAAVKKIGDYEKQFEMELKPTGTLRGRVLAKDGSPIAGVSVQCCHAASESIFGGVEFYYFEQTSTTDAQGNYEFKNLAPERKFSLYLGNQGRAAAGSARLMPGESRDVDLTKD